MTPDEQALHSCKYIAGNLCIIPSPLEDGWFYILSGGASRKILAKLRPDEFAAFFAQRWTADLALHEERSTAQLPPKLASAELDDLLANLDF